MPVIRMKLHWLQADGAFSLSGFGNTLTFDSVHDIVIVGTLLCFSD